MFSKVLSVIAIVAIVQVAAYYEPASSYVSRQLNPDVHGGYVLASSGGGDYDQGNQGYYRQEQQHQQQQQQQEEEHEHYPAYNYHYNYGVNDHHTGDKKTQSEEREGGVVRGEYSLLQPDGVVRTVKYIADKHHGFRATVYHNGHPVNHGGLQQNDYLTQ